MTRYAKFAIAVLGAASTAVAQGLVPDTVGQWLPVAIAFATALGVYAVPNTPPKGQQADPNISERDAAEPKPVLEPSVAVPFAEAPKLPAKKKAPAKKAVAKKR